MSDSREQFEAWVTDNWPKQCLGRFATGEYQGFTVQHCWTAWQASRQALVVELPAKIGHLPYNQTSSGRTNPEAEQYDEAIDDCREAIEAAGVRVKP